MSNATRGARYERELVTELDEAGYSTLRAPASGGGTGMDRPDVIALRDPYKNGTADDHNMVRLSDVWAMELKACESLPVYLSEAEIDALKRWCEKAGATPMIGISPDKRKAEYDNDRYIAIKDLARTDSGNYVVRESTDYRVFEDVF